MSQRREAQTANKPSRTLMLDEARQVLGLSVPTAARLAGVSKSAMYLACERGEVESTRMCGRILVKAVPFMRQFGLNVDDKVVAGPAFSLECAHAHESKSCRKAPE